MRPEIKADRIPDIGEPLKPRAPLHAHAVLGTEITPTRPRFSDQQLGINETAMTAEAESMGATRFLVEGLRMLREQRTAELEATLAAEKANQQRLQQAANMQAKPFKRNLMIN